VTAKNRPHESITWYVLLALILTLGVVFVWPCHASLGFLSGVSARIKPDAGGRLVGIVLISAVLGHFSIYWAMRGIYKLFDITIKREASPTDLWPPAILGIVEGLLYVIALVMVKPEFIGFWVAIKTAGGWVAWSGSSEDAEGENRARRRFYAFLIGNAVMLMGATTTYGLLKLFALNP
jgi:hypothetical protein